MIPQKPPNEKRAPGAKRMLDKNPQVALKYLQIILSLVLHPLFGLLSLSP
jgi:hypothetical protein